jgi:hypothetical protein
MPHILKRGIIELFMGTLQELREYFLKFWSWKGAKNQVV